MRIALVGNPNSGKTTLFNRLTGSRQRVGNWSGVTVERKTGQFELEGQTVVVTDLPGIYSLSVPAHAGAVDERIACDFIRRHCADIIINIVDAANLERNLYLSTQLLEMRQPMIIALNMSDIAAKRGISIDHQRLSQQLGCPVVPMVMRRGKGISLLKRQLLQQQKKKQQQLLLPCYTPLLEEAIADIMPELQDKNQRWLAVRLLEKDAYALQNFQRHAALDHKLQQWQHNFHQQTELDGDVLFADARYQFIQTLLQGVVQRSTQQRYFSQLLDHLVLNRWLGIPIFLLVMYLMFEFSITIGGALQPLFSGSSRLIFMDAVNALGQALHFPLWLNAILVQGIGLGVNTVLTFVPQIGCLFLFLSFIESSGYMARAAFVMDRFMQWLGLPGKSFVPLMIGFGCNVPAIMAARTLDSRRDRLLTIMMAPFMSCGARLAIFAVFSTAFFGSRGALFVFLLYVTGIIIAMMTGLILKLTLLRGESAPFVLELPPYHLPTIRILLRHTWMRLKHFLLRAGKVIIPICVLVGSLNAIEVNGSIQPSGSPNSVLSYAGRAITPVLSPMGVEQQNWPATVGLITGVLAKEVVVGTMNTLYSQGQQPSNHAMGFNLWLGIKNILADTYRSIKAISSHSLLNPFTANEASHDMSYSAMGEMVLKFGSSLTAFAYLLFVLLYTPCISTIAVTRRETHSHFWTGLSILWSLSIAYSSAVIFYQVATLMSHPWCSASWVLGLLAYLGVFIYGLLWLGRGKKFDTDEMIVIHRPADAKKKKRK